MDGFPFGPKEHFVVLDIGDNIDCCCIQVLSKGAIGEREKALWYTGALKHYSIGYAVFPTISPLYTATALYEPINKDDHMLFRVKEFIGEDPRNGRKLWDNIHKSLFLKKFSKKHKLPRLTDEELLEILRQS